MDLESKNSPFGENVLITVVASALIIVFGLASGVFSARLLGPKGRGELAAIQMLGILIAPFSTLGLPEALVYFSARDNYNTGRFLTSAVLLSALASIPLFAVAYVCMPALLAAEPNAIVVAARWFLLIIPVSALGGLPAYCLRGLKKFTVWNCFRIAMQGSWLLALATACVMRRLEPQFLAAEFLVSVGLVNLAVFYVTTRYIGGVAACALKDWGPMLRFGLPSVITGAPQVLNFKLDQILMAAFLPPQVLGLYVAAVGYSSVVQPLLLAIGIVQFPHVASKATWNSRVTSLASVTRIAAVLVLILVLFLTPIAPAAISILYGSKFTAAEHAAMVLVVAAGFLGFNCVLEEGLKGLGAPAAVMWAELGGLPVTAASLALLLQRLGIMGAAISSVIGYSTVTILLLVQAKALTGYRTAELFIAGKPEFRLIMSQVKAVRTLVAKLSVS